MMLTSLNSVLLTILPAIRETDRVGCSVTLKFLWSSGQAPINVLLQRGTQSRYQAFEDILAKI